MDVNGAIEFVGQMANSFKCISSLNCRDIDRETNEVVSLLEQGENYKELCEKGESDFNILVKKWDKLYEENKINKKYKAMLEDISLELNDTLIEYPKNKTTYSFNIIFKMFKQKHFPKPDIKEGD